MLAVIHKVIHHAFQTFFLPTPNYQIFTHIDIDHESLRCRSRPILEPNILPFLSHLVDPKSSVMFFMHSSSFQIVLLGLADSKAPNSAACPWNWSFLESFYRVPLYIIYDNDYEQGILGGVVLGPDLPLRTLHTCVRPHGQGGPPEMGVPKML